MDTLDIANDYVNGTWEEFQEKYKDVLDEGVMDYLGSHLEHRALWKGVPLSRDCLLYTSKIPHQKEKNGKSSLQV